MYSVVLLKEVFRNCTGAEKNPRNCFDWPPDVFALSSRLLEESGLYRRVVSPPQGQKWERWEREAWQNQVRQAGRKWAELTDQRLRENSKKILPIEIRRLRDALLKKVNEPVATLSADWDLMQKVLTLHTICDEAGTGLGVLSGSGSPVFRQSAARMLHKTGSLSRFPPQCVRVLPKAWTPQLGIDIRSLSHHLTAVHAEPDVTWTPVVQNNRNLERLELLLIPWPYQLSAEAFSAHETNVLGTMQTERFGFFKFAPPNEPPIQEFVKLVKEARSISGEVDMLVLPEAALTEHQLQKLEEALDEDPDLSNSKPMILAGVRSDAVWGGFSRNEAIFSYHSPSEDRKRISQPKHHRWTLDESQIRDYRLGEQLDPTSHWWEAIELPERRLNLIALTNWLLLCPLVCEDLARLEPVSRTLHAVGPTMVIALLLDGPQLASRWSARYATVLAEDPGSSVLTVTSLGMVMRSRPPGFEPKPIVALWNDAVGRQREIQLNPSKKGLLLSLEARHKPEWTADGREDSHVVLTLKGTYEL